MSLRKYLKNFICRLRMFLPRQKGAAILMYHSVGDNDVFFTVALETFSRQLDYLKKNNYQVVSLSDLVERLEKGRKIPLQTVVLRFDDGYRDNYDNVFPILKKYNFPATIFLTVGRVGQKLNNSQNLPLEILDWLEIREMEQSGLVDFQPHGLTHQKLDKISPIEAAKEIGEAKNLMEKELNKKREFFSYPFGRYNQSIIRLLKKYGFRAGLSLRDGRVKKGDNLFTLKRKSVNSETSWVEFKSMVR